MPLALFDGLRMDAVDPLRLDHFWTRVLGGDQPWQHVAMRAVDAPPVVKHRVHLDVLTRDVEELVARGARVLAPASETGLGWTVMADPEGGVLCAFVRDTVPAFRLHGIGVDSAQAAGLAAWWGVVLGAPVVREDGWLTLEGVTPDPAVTLDFADVPEPRCGPNRVRWILTGPPGAVDRLVAHGARLDEPDAGACGDVVVLADPEGNEFDVVERPDDLV